MLGYVSRYVRPVVTMGCFLLILGCEALPPDLAGDVAGGVIADAVSPYAPGPPEPEASPGEQQGDPAAVVTPAGCAGGLIMPETCNGEDDDCDGETDEGYADTDGDGRTDCVDPDMDDDGVLNGVDNCHVTPNEDQRDSNGDGMGDACSKAFMAWGSGGGSSGGHCTECEPCYTCGDPGGGSGCRTGEPCSSCDDGDPCTDDLWGVNGCG